MATRLLDRAVAPVASPPQQNVVVPDRAHDAVGPLVQLRDRLLDVIAARAASRWKEPPVFFFDRRRQAALELARPRAMSATRPEIEISIDALLPELYASIEIRRVARALEGLRSAAEELAADTPAARRLADLLAIPEDEVFTVLHPEQRTGFRLITRGVADIGQFHVLLEDAVTGRSTGGFLPGPPIPARFVAAYRDVNPTMPAGVPMVVHARHQLLAPSALRADGTAPAGFAGCEHWLWPAMPLGAAPRLEDERVIVLGAPAFDMTWDVMRPFPALGAEVRLLETLSPFRVAERLARLVGGDIQPARVPSRAA